MKIIDKAQWHIDAGENEVDVVEKFRAIFTFLCINDMLSSDGKEIFEFGIDSSISLNEQMLTTSGYIFLEKYYNDVINFSPIVIVEKLKTKL